MKISWIIKIYFLKLKLTLLVARIVHKALYLVKANLLMTKIKNRSFHRNRSYKLNKLFQ